MFNEAAAIKFNRRALGDIWTLGDLPPDWAGFKILDACDLNHDQALEAYEESLVDWGAFSRAVLGFQVEVGLAPDGKLGPNTLRSLRQRFGMAGERERLLTSVGGIEFYAAEEPTAPPALIKVPRGRNPLARRASNLWERFGQAIGEEAARYGLPIEAALAVFCIESIESGIAHDPRTGLVIIQYEDHVFSRLIKAPRQKPRYGSQQREWADFAKAAAINPAAAFEATSAGLAQVMGFNAEMVGYPDAFSMFQDFQRSCRPQVAAFFKYVMKAGLDDEIKRQDWYGFARGYNGPGKPGQYSRDLKQAYEAVQSLKALGADFRLEA